MSPDIGERVAILETSIKYLTEQLEDTHRKVEEMHAVLLQAKGAKWVLVGTAGIIGFLTAMMAKLFPLNGIMPK
jgi:hypothetical protein